MATGAAHKMQRAGRLDGRLILVLGAGSGIGRAVVEAMVAEDAKVVAFELIPEKCSALRTAYPAVRVIQGDVCKLKDIEAATSACAEIGLGKLDALINCVGLFDFYCPLGGIDSSKLEAGFDEIFHVNVLSGLVAAQACLPILRAARGTIILTSSSSGFYPGRGGILYVSSKFAIRGCVTALAHELAPDVRVNGVAPGGVLGTDLRGSPSLGLERMRMRADDERIADLKELTPLNVAMTPSEVAQSYVFLASEAAHGMTGEFLHPNGGLGIRG
jgi:NAD(P)-dependent dehydrogenase (short-subunit alcohol dehydrogenase family)